MAHPATAPALEYETATLPYVIYCKVRHSCTAVGYTIFRNTERGALIKGSEQPWVHCLVNVGGGRWRLLFRRSEKKRFTSGFRQRVPDF